MLHFLKGLGLGAGVMYLMDPDRGEARRQQITECVTDTTAGINTWLGHTMSDSVPNTLGLAAAAMGGIVGVRLFARHPVATLGLAAAGVVLARQLQSMSSQPYGHHLDPRAAASGAYRDAPMDLAEMSHYGNAGNGHSGGRQRNDPTNAPEFD